MPATPDLHLHGWVHERKIPGISVGVHQMQLVQGRPGTAKAAGGRAESDELVAQASNLFLGLGTSLDFRDYTLFTQVLQ